MLLEPEAVEVVVCVVLDGFVEFDVLLELNAVELVVWVMFEPETVELVVYVLLEPETV